MSDEGITQLPWALSTVAVVILGLALYYSFPVQPVSKPDPVLVETPNKEWGSGVPTEHGVLASAHVVQYDDWIINGEYLGSGFLMQGEAGTDTDYVLLDWHTDTVATINCDPWEHQRVYYRGYTRIGPYFVPVETEGWISNVDIGYIGKFSDTAAVDIGVTPGMSGGGFFNERGELIGLMGAMVPLQTYTYALMIPIPDELCP